MKTTSAFVKVGTGPGECVQVWGKDELGAVVLFRRYGRSERWQRARIVGYSGPRVLLELW